MENLRRNFRHFVYKKLYIKFYLINISLFFAIMAILCTTLLVPRVEKFLISQQCDLLPGKRNFDFWINPRPLKFKVYVFNVTNSEQVENGEIPILTEVGPYIYDEFRIKEKFSIDAENKTITYFEKRLFYFNSDDSGQRSHNDLLTTLDTRFMVASLKINENSPTANSSFLVNSSSYLDYGLRRSLQIIPIREFLFDGTPFACKTSKFINLCKYLMENNSPLLKYEMNISTFHFSMFAHFNNSVQGPFKIGTDSEVKGLIISFRNNRKIDYWNTEGHCNMLYSTDLLTFPSFYDKIPKFIEIFDPALCRKFELLFYGKDNISGLDRIIYKSKNIFNSSIEELCYDRTHLLNGAVKRPCNYREIFSLQSCINMDLLLSQPHFCGANVNLLKRIKGLDPNEVDHSQTVIIDLISGIPIEVNFRLQWNVPILKFKGTDANRSNNNYSYEYLFPIVWTEESFALPQYIHQELKEKFWYFPVFRNIKLLTITAGTILLIVAVLLQILYSSSNSVNTFTPSQDSLNLYPQLMNRNVCDENFKRNKFNAF